MHVELNSLTRIAVLKVPVSFYTPKLLTNKIFDYEKEIGFTIVEQAIVLVPEFEKVVCKLEQQVTLRGQSLVPAAGYTLDGRWKNIGYPGQYLYPVHQLSGAFKAKFLDSLKRALRKENGLTLFYDAVQQAWKTKWVVHCEPSLAGAGHVVRYLGQYTHRVAITNQRILNIADGKVTFIAKDYRDRAIKKPVTLDGVEFLRRFTMHILPKRFVKIRRFGIYNHTVKRNLVLQFSVEEKPGIDTVIKRQLPAETNVQRFERLTGVNPCICPVCKTGRMVTIRELPRIRSPAGFFLKQLPLHP